LPVHVTLTVTTAPIKPATRNAPRRVPGHCEGRAMPCRGSSAMRRQGGKPPRREKTRLLTWNCLICRGTNSSGSLGHAWARCGGGGTRRGDERGGSTAEGLLGRHGGNAKLRAKTAMRRGTSPRQHLY